eukprot:tig00000248_g21822.t1
MSPAAALPPPPPAATLPSARALGPPSRTRVAGFIGGAPGPPRATPAPSSPAAFSLRSPLLRPESLASPLRSPIFLHGRSVRAPVERPPRFFVGGALQLRVPPHAGPRGASAVPAEQPAAPRKRGRPRSKRAPASEAELFLTRELGMSRADVDRCLAAFPGLARLSVDAELRPSADALASAGLSAPELAAALPASPRVLAMGPARLRRKIELLRGAGLTGPETAGLLRADLHVLWVREETLHDRLRFARERFGVEPARLLLSTRTVGLSEGAMSESAAALERAGLAPDAARRLIARHPKLLSLASSGRLQALSSLLQSELSLDPPCVLRMIQRQPLILGMRTEGLSERITYMKALGLSRSEAARVVRRYPELLCRSLERTFLLKVTFFEGLGLQGPAIAKILSRAPMAFLRPLETGVRPSIAALAYHAALSRHDLAQVIVKFPPLLARSRVGLERSLRYLKSRGFLGPDLSALVRASPQILVLDPAANLEPKIRLLRSHGYGPQEIVRFPPTLAYSLPSRIRPRLEYLRALGRDPNLSPAPEHPDSSPPSDPDSSKPRTPRVSLSSALSPSDSAFAERVARTSVDEYSNFRSLLRPCEEPPVPLEELGLGGEASEPESLPPLMLTPPLPLKGARRRGWPRKDPEPDGE